jgi:type VI secretion system protein
MGQGHTLLTRIRYPEYAVARRAIPVAETRDSILKHLVMICETRAGTMPACPDFGTATVSEMVHAFPDAIAEMARSIRATIRDHEPRLANVRIVHIPAEDLTLRYEITADLVNGTSRSPIRFETSLDTNRKITVR